MEVSEVGEQEGDSSRSPRSRTDPERLLIRADGIVESASMGEPAGQEAPEPSSAPLVPRLPGSSFQALAGQRRGAITVRATPTRTREAWWLLPRPSRRRLPEPGAARFQELASLADLAVRPSASEDGSAQRDHHGSPASFESS